MRTFLVLAILFAWAGCGGGSMSALQVSATEYDPTALTQAPIADGASIALVQPPQGGYVVFVGTRVQGSGAATVQLHAQLADTDGTVVAEDVRTVSLMASAEDPNTFVPDLRSYVNVANIAVCPAQTTVDRSGHAFSLELDVTDHSTGSTGSTTVGVSTVCEQSDPSQLKLCQCVCAAGYYLGKCQ
jgi:hypothetical protein